MAAAIPAEASSRSHLKVDQGVEYCWRQRKQMEGVSVRAVRDVVMEKRRKKIRA